MSVNFANKDFQTKARQDVCSKAGNNFEVKPLGYTSFLRFKDLSSKQKLKSKKRPKLRPILVAEFRKGSRNLFYSYSYTQRLKSFDFLMNVVALAVPSRKGKPRGLNAGKKKKIVEKLALLMPHKNRVFWHELPESENSKDLLGREG